MPIIITTDSSSDLPAALRKELGIRYIPLHVRVGARTGRDCVDIFPEDIYRAYSEDGLFPKTSAPSIGEYEAFFRRFTEQGHAVVHIALSSGLSSAYQTARLASQELSGEVYVVDSRLFCTAAGMLCVQAAKLRDQGLPAGKIAEILAQLRTKVRSYFYLDRLDMVSKSGRVPAVLALGANLLNIHPSFTADAVAGNLAMGKKYRHKSLVAQRLWLEDALAALRGKIDQELVFFMHTNEMAREIYEDYNQLAQTLLPGVKRWVMDGVGCMVLSHCGFNCLAVVGMEKEAPEGGAA